MQIPPQTKKILATPMGWASLLDRARKLLRFGMKILWKMAVLQSNKKRGENSIYLTERDYEDKRWEM
jgi:hypothetical protein